MPCHLNGSLPYFNMAKWEYTSYVWAMHPTSLSISNISNVNIDYGFGQNDYKTLPVCKILLIARLSM